MTPTDLSDAMYCEHRRTAEACQDCASQRVYGADADQVREDGLAVTRRPRKASSAKGS